MFRSMAKLKFDKLMQELANARLRLSGGEWRGEEYTAMSRVRSLGQIISTQAGDELHRHVVVASIAALQTYHRAILVALVGCGSPYKERAAELVDDKFTLREALMLLGQGEMTAAELIAHSAPAGSIEALANALSTILACDIRGALAGAVSPFSRHDPGATPILSDVDGLFVKLRNAFNLRNILAHEVAPNLEVPAETADEVVKASESWMAAVEGIMWAKPLISQPLTQFEMNCAAGDQLREARRGLAIALKSARRSSESSGRAAEFRANQRAWRAMANEWVRLAYWSRQGTMWPSVGAMELARLTKERTKSLAGWQNE